MPGFAWSCGVAEMFAIIHAIVGSIRSESSQPFNFLKRQLSAVYKLLLLVVIDNINISSVFT